MDVQSRYQYRTSQVSNGKTVSGWQMFGIQAIVQSKGPVFGFFLVILLKGSEYWTIQTPYHSKTKQV